MAYNVCTLLPKVSKSKYLITVLEWMYLLELKDYNIEYLHKDYIVTCLLSGDVDRLVWCWTNNARERKLNHYTFKFSPDFIYRVINICADWFLINYYGKTIIVGRNNDENLFCFLQVLEICIAILVHKSIIVFSLSVKLVQSAVRPLWVAAYIGVFAMMSPLGIGIGIGVIEAKLAAGTLIQAILEGLAAGTFVYITFLEILPHELNSPGKQLLKVLFILLGFSIMAGLTFLGWH